MQMIFTVYVINFEKLLICGPFNYKEVELKLSLFLIEFVHLKNNNYTEDELVSLLKNKDIKAFDTLYNNYSSALFGVISRIIPSEEIAQDILQDVFVKNLEKHRQV